MNEYIRLYIKDDKDEWDNYVPFAIFSYNNSPHTQTKIAPQELLFGTRARCPSEIIPVEKMQTYNDLLRNLEAKLRESRLIAALNLNESKFM